MSAQILYFQTATLNLGEGLELVQCHGFPELSSLGDRAGRGAVGLRSKIRSLLESPDEILTISLHRRFAGKDARVEQIMLQLDAPKKRVEWQSDVELRFDYITWSEADDLFLAYVPAFGLQIIAAKPDQVAPRVKAHIRLALVESVKRVTLKQLAASQWVQGLRAEEMGVTAKIKTPRELAMEDAEEGDKKSVLQNVAVKLGRPHTCLAFEMHDTLGLLRETLEGENPASVLLVGPPGVGKSAVVRELARTIPREVWSTSGAQLIAGQCGFGMWQERCRDLCKEVAKSKVILHVGQLVELMEVGQHSANAQSIASFLRPAIARNEIIVIAECTVEQLAIIERRDPHIAGAFIQVRVPEPDVEKTRKILGEVFQQVARKDSDFAQSAPALDWMHRLHQRYATYSANPGRVLRFLTALVAEQPPEHTTQLSLQQVTTAFSRETGLPQSLLDDQMPLDLGAARDWFAERVIGQPEPLEAVVDLLAKIKARLNRPKQPLASFLFVGPTGTGKTELAKALGEFVFGSSNRLSRFDLSEFADAVSVQRLIGGPGRPEGLLTAKVREQPFSVLLFDEFEKADPAFFDLLLQILGDGRLTDAEGRVADFSNTVVIMTSNLGAREFQRGSMGFPSGESDDGSGYFEQAAKHFLRPELLNRLGAVLRFHALAKERMLEITRRHIDLLRRRDGLRLRDVDLRLGPGVEEALSVRGYDPKYGARPLKRVLERDLMVPLAEALNEVKHRLPLIAEITLENGALRMNLRQRQAREELADSVRAVEMAETVLTLRRTLAKLAGCPSVMDLENEISVLRLLEKRAAKRGWLGTAEQERIQRLAQLRKVVAELSALVRRMDELETDVLGTLHLHGDCDLVGNREACDAIQKQRIQIQRDVFRLIHPRADDIVMGIYSEHRDWMETLIRIYLDDVVAMQGKLEAFEFVLPPEGRGSVERLPRREPAKNLASPMEKPPKGWVGAILHWGGYLLNPVFLSEAGLHKMTLNKTTRLCLVEAVAIPREDYAPPSGIFRAGSITEKAFKLRRSFDADTECITDTVIGTSTWYRAEPDNAMHRLIEAALNRAIENLA